jgi:imidazolonepropionase-like amidohydrolase
MVFVVVLGAVMGCASAQSTTALVGPTALNPADSTVVEDATILVKGDRIAAVGPSETVDVPPGATVHEVPGAYVIPGLIDGHVHFFQSGGLYTRPDALDLRAVRPYAEEIRRIKARLPDTFRRYLRSGITGVVDTGGPMWNLDVRARADTTALAPTVAVSGPLISSVSREVLDAGDPPILHITTPAAARDEVQRQVAAGVDLVKIWYIVGDDPSSYRPVVEAAIDEAHAAETRVAVHATQLETARAAVEAGADVLVHSVFDRPVDDAFVRLLTRNDVLYVPTLMVRERYRQVFGQEIELTPAEHRLGQKEVLGSLTDVYTLPDSLVPLGLRQRMRRRPTVESDTTALRNLKRLHDAGGSIAAGTDAGNIGTPHGPALFYELQLMEAAGLSPQEILATATAGGARLMGRDDLGRVAAGMQADLVVLDKNPFADLSHVQSIRRVMTDGRLYTPETLLPRTPTAVVKQARNALNMHDAAAFVDAFAPDVRVYAASDSLLLHGRDALATRARSLFATAPTLHVQMHEHTVAGDTVVTRQTMQGHPRFPQPQTRVVTYQVQDGAISRMWIGDE